MGPQDTKDDGDDIFKQLTSKLGSVFVAAEEDSKKVCHNIFLYCFSYFVGSRGSSNKYCFGNFTTTGLTSKLGSVFVAAEEDNTKVLDFIVL